MSNIFYIGVIVLLKTAIGCQDIGEECLLRSSRSPGTCKPLKDCRHAYDELLGSGKYPQICGFQRNQPLVCCLNPRKPDTSPKKPDTSPKKPDTTPTKPDTSPTKPDTSPRIPDTTPRKPDTSPSKPDTIPRKPGAISRKKCEEYASYVNKTERTFFGEKLILFECDNVHISVVGGTPAGRREFPHMAAIGYETTPGNLQWLCGGTILSENYILTAAHCVDHQDQGDPKLVRVGVTALNSTDERQEIKVAEGIQHPEYKTSSHYHDIALLKLQTPIKFDQFARPACLQLNNEVSIQNARATGWGHTTWGGSASNDLLFVDLKVFDFKFCNESYKNNKKLNKGIIDDIQLCAGSLVEEKDTCQGDSGGPLQIVDQGFGDNNCMYDIIGVTSFGKGCTGNTPGAYVRVSYYVKWIEDIVWPNA